MWRRPASEGDGLRQFPQVLGIGGQKELVFGSIWAAEARLTEPEYALQMSEEHLDLLSFATWDGVGLGLCDRIAALWLPSARHHSRYGSPMAAISFSRLAQL
jgi:hypothetical protein